MEKIDINIYLNATLFQHDRANNILFQADRISNRVQLNRSPQADKFYLLRFNCVTGIISFNDGTQPEIGSHEKLVTIPKVVFNWSESSIELLNSMSKALRWNFFLADRATVDRINGKLPLLNINGEKYHIDIRSNEFRHVQNAKIILKMKDMTPQQNGLGHSGYYNKKTKMLDSLYNTDTSVDDLLFIEVPPRENLDPVGVCREYGLEDISAAHDTPVLSEVAATTRPLNLQEIKSRQLLPKGLESKRKKSGIGR